MGYWKHKDKAILNKSNIGKRRIKRSLSNLNLEEVDRVKQSLLNLNPDETKWSLPNLNLEEGR